MVKNVPQLVAFLIAFVDGVRKVITVLTWVASALDMMIDLLNGHPVSVQTHFTEPLKHRD